MIRNVLWAIATSAMVLQALPAIAETRTEPFCDSCLRASRDLVDMIRLKMRHERIGYADLGRRGGLVFIRNLDAKRESDMRRALHEVTKGDKHYSVVESAPGSFVIFLKKP